MFPSRSSEATQPALDAHVLAVELLGDAAVCVGEQTQHGRGLPAGEPFRLGGLGLLDREGVFEEGARVPALLVLRRPGLLAVGAEGEDFAHLLDRVHGAGRDHAVAAHEADDRLVDLGGPDEVAEVLLGRPAEVLAGEGEVLGGLLLGLRLLLPVGLGRGPVRRARASGEEQRSDSQRGGERCGFA